MGSVGQSLASRCAEVGFRVLGFDSDDAKVTGLNAGYSAIEHFPDEQIMDLIRTSCGDLAYTAINVPAFPQLKSTKLSPGLMR